MPKFFQFTRFQPKAHKANLTDPDQPPQIFHVLPGVGPLLVESHIETYWDGGKEIIGGTYTHIQMGNEFGVQVTETVEEVLAIFQAGTKDEQPKDFMGVQLG